MMKFKLDENLPNETAELLRHENYDALTVLEQGFGGKKDAEIAALCQEEQRILITLDTDFSDIRTYPPHQFSGIIILRMKQQDKNSIQYLMRRILMALPHEPLMCCLWIVDETRIRIRSSR